MVEPETKTENDSGSAARRAPAGDAGVPARRGGAAWGALGYGLIAGIILSIIAAYCAPVACNLVFWSAPAHRAVDNKVKAPSAAAIAQCTARLERELAALLPQAPYLVVSSSDNTFVLRRGATELRRGLCSTGSYVLLKTRDNSRKWVFSTPRGRLRVQDKLVDPVWRMPDWAFIEEGRPVPAADSPERFEHGVLGAYAMILGEGYMVHGTLYQRFLGQPVTHGCVRMGDDDLEATYLSLTVGSMVFMY